MRMSTKDTQTATVTATRTNGGTAPETDDEKAAAYHGGQRTRLEGIVRRVLVVLVVVVNVVAVARATLGKHAEVQAVRGRRVDHVRCTSTMHDKI